LVSNGMRDGRMIPTLRSVIVGRSRSTYVAEYIPEGPLPELTLLLFLARFSAWRILIDGHIKQLLSHPVEDCRMVSSLFVSRYYMHRRPENLIMLSISDSPSPPFFKFVCMAVRNDHGAQQSATENDHGCIVCD
jgi:hypothetical protein